MSKSDIWYWPLLIHFKEVFIMNAVGIDVLKGNPLRSITRSGENTTVITSMFQRQKRSINALLTWLPYFCKMTAQQCWTNRLHRQWSLSTLNGLNYLHAPGIPGCYGNEQVGPSPCPQLMAEIGSVTRFTHREALTVFADKAPGKTISVNITKAYKRQRKARHICENHCFKSRSE